MQDASTGSGPHSIARVCRLPLGRTDRQGPDESWQIGHQAHIVVDRAGIPAAVTISAANVHDSQLLEETVDAIPPLRLPGKRRGRPRKRPV
jgi:hypothetical protein